jgi:hypothetical protein
METKSLVQRKKRKRKRKKKLDINESDNNSERSTYQDEMLCSLTMQSNQESMQCMW